MCHNTTKILIIFERKSKMQQTAMVNKMDVFNKIKAMQACVPNHGKFNLEQLMPATLGLPEAIRFLNTASSKHVSASQSIDEINRKTLSLNEIEWLVNDIASRYGDVKIMVNYNLSESWNRIKSLMV